MSRPEPRGTGRIAKVLGAAVAGLFLASLLSSCGTDEAVDASSENVVNVYNWADYIDLDVLTQFEDEYGIRVNYDVYDSPATVDVKLLTGNSGYDVVVHNAFRASSLAPVGVFAELQMERLPNARHLDPATWKQLDIYEAVSGFNVPYHWGTVGLAYNVDLVRERIGEVPMDTSAIVFDPVHAARLADCGISLQDDPTEVIPLALAYLGRDPSAVDNENLTAAEELLRGVRPYIRYFANSKAIIDLPNKEVCVAHSWSGDVAQANRHARETGISIDLRYAVPREGAPLWIDGLYIPADAPHPDNAYLFLDFMMRPEIAAANALETNFANANRASWSLLGPDLLDDPAVFPDQSMWNRLFVLAVEDPKRIRPRTQAFARVKSGL